MKCLMWTFATMDGNVREARKYAHKAHELADRNPAVAKWCIAMARHHLEFNQEGMAIYQKDLHDMQHMPEYAALYPGVKAVHDERMAELERETAEVRAMLETHK